VEVGAHSASPADEATTACRPASRESGDLGAGRRVRSEA